MRVLYLIDSVDAPGGAEQALAGFAPFFTAHEVELHVGYLKERLGLQQRLRAGGATVVSLAGPGGRLGWTKRAHALIRECRPDLVHTTLFDADVTGRIAASWARVPVVSSLVSVPYGAEHRSDPSLSAMRVRGAHAADAATAQLVTRFHAITSHVADVMSARLHIPKGNIDVIPRGREASSLGSRTEERRKMVRASLGVPDDVPLLLAAARQERRKGFDILLRAFPFVLAQFPSAQLLIAGQEGNLSPTIEQLIAAFAFGGAVRLLGPRTDVPDLMCAADVFVLPSWLEGLGSTLLEAMATSTPIVASNLPPVREVLEDGRTALLVQPEDPSALGVALACVLQDPCDAAARADSARTEFEHRFTMDRIGAEMIAFYHRALDDSLASKARG